MTGDLTLAGLIDLAFERHEVRSGAELERVAQGLGHKIVATTINHLRAGTYKPKPRKYTLEAIASLAGVPLAVAYESAGLPAPGPPFAEQVAGVEGVDYLTAAERDVIIQMCRVLAARHVTEEGVYSQAVGSQEGGVSELQRTALPRAGSNGADG